MLLLRVMRRILLVGLLWTFWTGRADAQPGQGPELLVELERRFAADVAARGIQAAFLEHLGEGAIVFRPRPVEAAPFFRTQSPDGGVLEWAPAYARLAESGDLGFTTGPWRYRAAATNPAVNAAGLYVRVWQRGGAGWKAVLDAGVGAAQQPFPYRLELDGPDEPDEPEATWKRTQRTQDLRRVDEEFGRRAARQGESVALDEHGHRDVRLLRTGIGPVSGRRNAVRVLGANSRLTRDVIRGFGTAGSADLGWVWGESELLGSGTTPHQVVRSWLRVWRRSGWSGTWRVVLDYAADYPPTGGSELPAGR